MIINVESEGSITRKQLLQLVKSNYPHVKRLEEIIDEHNTIYVDKTVKTFTIRVKDPK